MLLWQQQISYKHKSSVLPLLAYGKLQTATIYFVTALHRSGTNWLLLDKFLWNFILGERVLQSAEKIELWLKMDKSQQLVRSWTASCGSSFAVCCCCVCVLLFTALFKYELPISNKVCPYSRVGRASGHDNAHHNIIPWHLAIHTCMCPCGSRC